MFKSLINSRKKIFTIIISTILVSILLISGCGKKEKEDVIKIGAILPLTGAGAEVGNYNKQAMIYAKNKYSNKFEKYNHKLNILFEDSMTNPKDGLNAFKKLESKNILVYNIQMSSVNNAIVNSTTSNNKIIFGFASTEKPWKEYKAYYINYISSDQQSNIFNLLTAQDKKIYIFYLNDDYGLSIKKSIESKFPEHKKLQYSTFGRDTNIKNLISLIDNLNKLDSIILLGYGKQLSEIVKELKIRKYQNKIYTTPEFLFGPSSNISKEYLNNVFSIDFQPLGKKITTDFVKAVGRKPNLVDILGYTSVSLVSEIYLHMLNNNEKLYDLNNFLDKTHKQTLINKIKPIKNINNRIIYYKLCIKNAESGKVVRKF